MRIRQALWAASAISAIAVIVGIAGCSKPQTEVPDNQAPPGAMKSGLSSTPAPGSSTGGNGSTSSPSGKSQAETAAPSAQ
jgi:hypothetical protein